MRLSLRFLRGALVAAPALALLFVTSLVVSSCHAGPDCTNGVCTCPEGADCEVLCDAPPCHLACAGNNPSCVGGCADGSCSCGGGSSCDFTCKSAPCHVTCDAVSTCTGTCADGDCVCGVGSKCDFKCASGPCHVKCEGSNPTCNGVCANGTCTCGPMSDCRFSCLDKDCGVVCAAGSTCVLDCPAGGAGEQGCMFTSCAAGQATICPGGKATTCGAPCPPAGT